MLKVSGVKKLLVEVILAVVFCLAVVVLASHDDHFYTQPIFQIHRVINGKQQKVVDEFHNVDHQTDQKLTGKIINGKYSGRTLTIQNTYSDSNAMDHKLAPGQKVFIALHTKPRLHATVKDLKRDVPIAILFAIAISLLLIVLQFRGFVVIFSILVNTLLFWLAIRINERTNGAPVILIFSVLAVIFCALTLFLVMGWTKKMMVTLMAVVGSTTATILIMLLIFGFTQEKGVYYESMQYVTQLPKPLFLAEVLIGVLGAVMDEATDIVASLATLKKEKPEMSRMQLFNSGRAIGRSIMGPLINVLFFIFMAETFAMTILFLKNGNSWGYSFSMNMSLGMISSLVSAIGIVLTVLLSSLFAGLWIKGDEK